MWLLIYVGGLYGRRRIYIHSPIQHTNQNLSYLQRNHPWPIMPIKEYQGSQGETDLYLILTQPASPSASIFLGPHHKPTEQGSKPSWHSMTSWLVYGDPSNGPSFFLMKLSIAIPQYSKQLVFLVIAQLKFSRPLWPLRSHPSSQDSTTCRWGKWRSPPWVNTCSNQPHWQKVAATR